MYELFLLGKLLARPWYGYEFQQVLGAFVGPQRRVSWGTVYPLFQRMERDGLIRSVSQRGERDARDKQAYTITAAGKKRFQELMRDERAHDPDFRETFRVKLGHFSRVDDVVRRAVSATYVGRLEGIAAHTAEMARRVRLVTEMGEDERVMILRAINLEHSLAAAELQLVRRELREFLGSETEGQSRKDGRR